MPASERRDTLTGVLAGTLTGVLPGSLTCVLSCIS
jgi:hypothetical protein